MKTTQRKAILNALIRGKKLTTLDAVRDFGTVKLSNRICEWERELRFLCDRKQVNFKTRYGTAGKYFVYQMKVSDRLKFKKLLMA